jgi:hypothetical protein
MSYDSKDNTSRSTNTAEKNKLSLPDFDTLREMAKNDPEELENLRLALCNKVINEAPDHAKQRLQGLMFQINSRRQLASSHLEACKEISNLMHESLQRMQAMLKDLRSMQSESILLSTRHFKEPKTAVLPKADVIPFKPRTN